MELGSFQVDGWERLCEHIREQGSALAYLTVVERDGRTENAIGRLNLDAEGEGDLYEAAEPAAERAERWLSERIQGHCCGEPVTRLRVHTYGPKGESRSSFGLVVTSMTRLVRQQANQGADDVIQQLVLARGEREEHQNAQMIEQLLSASERLAQIALNLAEGTAKHYHGALQQLSVELVATRGQNDKLVGSLVQQRMDHAESHALHLLEQSRQDQEQKRLELTQQLGKQALEQMGGLAALFVAQQQGGLDPKLAPVLSALQQHDTIRSALEDPHVQAMLREPGTLDILAQYLQRAAEQRKEQQPS